MSRLSGQTVQQEQKNHIEGKAPPYPAAAVLSSGFLHTERFITISRTFSRSYDLPEGIHKLTKKAATPPRSTVSSPARGHSPHLNSANSRNQTILDDAVWMSERIYSLNKTGLLRYPSVSKLHDQTRDCADDEEMSRSSRRSTFLHAQTEREEPLSAFKLSEVTLNEEDLLTDILTCQSPPVPTQSCSKLDNVASDQHLETYLTRRNSKNSYSNTDHSNMNPCDSLKHLNNSVAVSECTTFTGQGDLLSRLEALQYRAELATKERKEFQFETFSPIWRFRNEQASSQLEQDTLHSNQRRGASVHQSNVLTSSASSALSMDYVSWPDEPGCWLKAVVKEDEAEPFTNHTFLSSNRQIRPEYYLPLSKEEDPVTEARHHLFPPPKRADNVRRLSQQGAPSSSCKPLNFGHCRLEELNFSRRGSKETISTAKSRRSPKSSTHSLNGFGKTHDSFSSHLNFPSSPSPSPVPTRRKLSHRPVYKVDSQAAGNNKEASSKSLEFDCESNWISEENVEGFLSSRSVLIDEVSGLITAKELSSPTLDTCSVHHTASTSSNLLLNVENLQIEDSRRGLLCFSHTSTKNSMEILGSIPKFDDCKQFIPSSQGGSSPIDQTGTHLGISASFLKAQDQKSQSSVCQSSPNQDVRACYGDSHYTKYVQCFDKNADEDKEQAILENSPLSCSAAPSKPLKQMVEASTENVTVLDVHISSLENDQKSEGIHVGPLQTGRLIFHSPSPLVPQQHNHPAASSPENCVVEDQPRSYIANRMENAVQGNRKLSHSLSKQGCPEHRSYARIIRSLSFNENERNEINASAELWSTKDLSEPQSTSFSHHWNSSPAMENPHISGGKDPIRTCDEESVHYPKFPELSDGLTLQETRASMISFVSYKNEVFKVGEDHHSGKEARAVMFDGLDLDKSCVDVTKTASDDENEASEIVAVDPDGMANIMLESSEIERQPCEVPKGRTRTLQHLHDHKFDDQTEVPSKAQYFAATSEIQADNDKWHLSESFSEVSNDEEIVAENKMYDLQGLGTLDANSYVNSSPNKQGLLGMDKSSLQDWKFFSCGFTGDKMSSIHMNPSVSPEKEQFSETGVNSLIGQDGEVLDSKIIPALQNGMGQTEAEIFLSKSIISEQHVGMAAFESHNNRSMQEDAIDGKMSFNLPSSSMSKDCGRGEAPSSLLSIYKNPLWLDEVSTDFERSHGSDENCKLLESEKSKVGFSKRSLDGAWDTYEGIGGFISLVSNSPPCTRVRVSEADCFFMGSDNLIHSSNSNDLPLVSEWDAKISATKKLRSVGEEPQDGSVDVCRSCLIFEDSFISSQVPGLNVEEKQSNMFDSQSDQYQESALNLCLSRNRDATIGAVDQYYDITCNSQRPLSHIQRVESNLTTKLKKTGSHGLEDGSKCMNENNVWPYGPFLIDSSHSSSRVLAKVFQHTQAGFSTSDKLVAQTEKACLIDEANTVGKVLGEKYGHDGIESRKGTGPTERISDTQQQWDHECYDKECSQPLDTKLVPIGTANINYQEENCFKEGPGMQSKNVTEAHEDVKQVTFIFPDSKDQQKNVQTNETPVPEVPLDVLSNWVLSFFSHATKGSDNCNGKEQKQVLMQDKMRKDQSELNRIGKKVEDLEAEIYRFKEENRMLQNLVKCMIRKMKQLQHGLRRRRRRGSSRGFLTCIYSVRVKKTK